MIWEDRNGDLFWNSKEITIFDLLSDGGRDSESFSNYRPLDLSALSSYLAEGRLGIPNKAFRILVEQNRQLFLPCYLIKGDKKFSIPLQL